MSVDRPTRRWLLQAASSMAGAALTAPLTSKLVLGKARFRAYPFTLGVASGDPTADGFVLWTRLAPTPLAAGGMPHESMPVLWQVARDEQFRNIVKRGEALAAPERAHSVHVEVTGLEPDRWYFYRFLAGGEASPTGRTRTFPAPGSKKDRLRFAFASCQHFGQGYFTAYQAMMEDDLDLILHLGDYIYETSGGRKVRAHLPEPTTLEGYRNLHALYKTDAHLQAAHAWHPFAVTWDDHEVDNDYAGDQSLDRMPVEAFIRRRAAAYQAYYEHMPLRRSAMTLYRTLTFGDLAHFAILDNRQYRSDQACQGPLYGGQLIENCEEREAPERTVLGPAQERWLLDELTQAKTRWRVIGQQMLMAQLDQRAGEGEAWWSDGWDGYPAGRRRILNHIKDHNIENCVVLGGDIHSFWVTDLKADFNDASSSVIATEFVGTSVTSNGAPYEQFAAMLPENPHVKFFESRKRGYVLAHVTPKEWRTELRVVSTTAQPDAVTSTLRSYIVESGRPGAQPG